MTSQHEALAAASSLVIETSRIFNAPGYQFKGPPLTEFIYSLKQQIILVNGFVMNLTLT